MKKNGRDYSNWDLWVLLRSNAISKEHSSLYMVVLKRIFVAWMNERCCPHEGSQRLAHDQLLNKGFPSWTADFEEGHSSGGNEQSDGQVGSCGGMTGRDLEMWRGLSRLGRIRRMKRSSCWFHSYCGMESTLLDMSPKTFWDLGPPASLLLRLPGMLDFLQFLNKQHFLSPPSITHTSPSGSHPVFVLLLPPLSGWLLLISRSQLSHHFFQEAYPAPVLG